MQWLPSLQGEEKIQLFIDMKLEYMKEGGKNGGPCNGVREIFFKSSLKRRTILYLQMHVSIITSKAHCSYFWNKPLAEPHTSA